MTWNYVKDKVLVFGEDDYVFSCMFAGIISEYDKVEGAESEIFYTYIMLKELMDEGLVEVYLIPGNNIEEYIYSSEEDIETFISIIDTRWKEIKYSLTDFLFAVSSTEKGVECVKNKTFLDEE